MDILTEIREACAYISINDTTTRNSLSESRATRIRELLEGFEQDRSIRGVCIRGTGDVFCSGHNLQELRAATTDSARELFLRSSQLAQCIRKLELPVLACLNGPAIGAGVQLALACDCIIASEESFFQTPGGSKGWFCFTPAVELLFKVPQSVAREMLFTGATLRADRALQLGVVNQVAPASELTTQCEQFFRRMLSGDREMIARGKALIHRHAAVTAQSLYPDATELMATTLLAPAAQRRIRPKKS
jgi:enoyl-CoA hydratase/carnithine racemase